MGSFHKPKIKNNERKWSHAGKASKCFLSIYGVLNNYCVLVSSVPLLVRGLIGLKRSREGGLEG